MLENLCLTFFLIVSFYCFCFKNLTESLKVTNPFSFKYVYNINFIYVLHINLNDITEMAQVNSKQEQHEDESSTEEEEFVFEKNNEDESKSETEKNTKEEKDSDESESEEGSDDEYVFVVEAIEKAVKAIRKMVLEELKKRGMDNGMFESMALDLSEQIWKHHVEKYAKECMSYQIPEFSRDDDKWNKAKQRLDIAQRTARRVMEAAIDDWIKDKSKEQQEESDNDSMK